RCHRHQCLKCGSNRKHKLHVGTGVANTD
ncbi:hypothetical protein D031_0447B, partial [Vibrio parahaemolyticus VP-48]